MNTSLRTTVYLSPGERAFWRWSEDGTVVEWSDDGQTIVFREELKTHLQRFIGRGLPSFESLLLILAVTRSSWPSRSELLCNLTSRKVDIEVIRLLDQVHLASRGRCETVEDRAALLFLMTDRIASVVNSEVTKEVAHLLEVGFEESVQFDLSQLALRPLAGPQALQRSLRELRPVLEGFSGERLNLLVDTGVEELPSAVPNLELPPPARARALLRALRSDQEELAQVAKLAGQMLAAISLPRHLEVSDDRPLGGVSDITNRGTIDRLLVSELAYDDLTLAVRVANNEAMYLRRESPPATPPSRQTVLLDAGIRTWGLPRLYVAAAGLAIQASADPSMELDMCCLLQNETVPVDLTTRAGLISQLSHQSPHRYPAASWDQQTQRWLERAGEAPPVFVTTPETMQDPEFLPHLGPYLADGLIVITVDRSGRFAITEWSLRGQKTLRRASFSREELSRKRLTDESSEALLPGIDRLPNFPLRLAPELNADSAWYVPKVGCFHISRDGRLLFADTDKLGSQQLLLGLGPLEWCSQEPIGKFLMAVTRHPKNQDWYQLVRISVEAERLGAATITEFRGQGISFLFENQSDLFAYLDQGRITRIDLSSGEFRESIELPKYLAPQTQAANRFFRNIASSAWGDWLAMPRA